MEGTGKQEAHWQGSLPSLIKFTLTPEPDEPILQRPVPTPSSSSSSLLAALEYAPPKRHRYHDRTSPPPFYNPYPYARAWTLDSKLNVRERWFWHNREDDWARHIDGEYISEVRQRVWSIFTDGVRRRQLAAKKEWEDARLLQQVPLQTEDVNHTFDFHFVAKQREKGISVKALITGRRAIESVLMSPKATILEKYPHDTMRVQIKWPAYPDYEPVRTIFVTVRTGRKRGRRPCTCLEFTVALAGIITQFYSEVSNMEPYPAFAHLALGPGEGRISLYALRLFGIHAAPNGIFELELELDDSMPTPQPHQQASTSATEPSVGLESECSTSIEASYYPPWERTLPVTCTVASPPKITAAQYLAHVDPLAHGKVSLPAWQDE